MADSPTKSGNVLGVIMRKIKFQVTHYSLKNHFLQEILLDTMTYNIEKLND